ncbi:hypothetical protein ACFHWW_26410 [Ensifer sp. P24N7]|uniref:hypothetical protein n=1 Tax=Sinorhizobium sp. P24N7 TaxID=3348358 RepID=UPI0035F3E6A1
MLLKSNLVLIERVVHATRTVLREYRLEVTPFREGQLVSAVYEEIVADGTMDLSYEETLRRVDEMFRVSKWRMEAREAEAWPGASASWLMEVEDEREAVKRTRFWVWLEERRRGLAWVLFGAALAMTAVIAQMVMQRPL